MPVGIDIQRLYDEHAQALFVFLLNFARNREDARDVLQEVFIKLARQPALLCSVRDSRAFLLRLTHNSAIDLLRRRGTRDKHHEQFGSEHSVFASGENPDEDAFREALSTALGELPPDQRAVLHLKLWEEFTFEQIAEALGIQPNTAASRYRYGIDKLRTLLRPLYNEIK